MRPEPAAPKGVLGLIVNPVAGIGGKLALKGSDDLTAIAHAISEGAEPVAPARARRALAAVHGIAPDLTIAAPAAGMGAELARDAGFAVEPLAFAASSPTSAVDTRAAAAELLERGIALILFVGGDGTARDIVAVVGKRLPVLGVPSGVKMRSGVFGTTPEAAGEAAGRYLSSSRYSVIETEVLDAVDPTTSSETFGVALVPDVPGRVQSGKAGRPADATGALAALCEAIGREMIPGRLYLLGPGTTTGRIMRGLGMESTPLGFDAVRDGELVGADLDEEHVFALLRGTGEATLVLGVIGGQGFLLGRGNQQISPRVVRRLGVENIVIVAGADKVAALNPPVLHVDLGDTEQDRILDGYRQVRVAPGRSVMLRVAS